jgi:hypothetical protein
MMFKKFTQIWRKIEKKTRHLFDIPKRQKFIVSVVVLSLVLFFSEQWLGRGGIYVAFLLSLLTGIFLYWAEKPDFKANFSPQIFILPLFYSMACALFYFLVPARLITRIGMTSLYALGLYSLLLSENIFIVSSIRTIALLSSARTVSFIITLLSYFFMADVVFSLHLNVLVTIFFIFIFSYLLILHSIWTHTLENSFHSHLQWVLLLSICIVELAFALWFWSTTPTLIGLLLTGLFYVLVGISQVWLDKRLFKSVMWEYLWVVVIIFLIFVTFS